MAQITVNVVDPTAGAALMGGGGGGQQQQALGEQKRQFDQGQQQQGEQFQQKMGQDQQQFERQAGQQDQQLQMSKEQMAFQKKEQERARQMALLEQAMMAGRQRMEDDRTRIHDEITSATMANDLDALEKLYPQLDETTSGLSDSDAKLTRLSLLDHFVASAAQGDVDPQTGKPGAPLIQTDLSSALQTHLASEHQRETDLADAVGLAVTAHSSFSTGRKAHPEIDAKYGQGQPHSFVTGSPNKIHSIDDLRNYQMELKKADESTTPETGGGNGTFADDFVMRTAPHLGLSEGEVVRFRTMVQNIESATAMNAMGMSRSRDEKLAQAGALAEGLVAEGMEADKVSFVLSSLMKAGADGRKALKKGFDEKSAATLAATGKETTERPSAEDAAYYQKVEQMGVLGMSLRGKDGKALFKPVASVREVKGTDGTSKLERAGVDMTTILEEAAADFIDNGQFDRRDKYLQGLPGDLRGKVEKALVARQKNFENAVRLQGFDPEGFDLKGEKKRAEETSKGLRKKVGAIENEAFLSGRKSRVEGMKKEVELRQRSEDEVMTPLYKQLAGLMSGGE